MTRPRTSKPMGASTVASRALFALAIAGSALAVGSVHSMTLCVLAMVLAAALALTWWTAEPVDARPAATLLVVAGVSLTAYTSLQCVPMPISWLAAIAPHNADVWSRALSPLHEPGPQWAPLTLDPNATRIEVLKGIAYLLTLVTALRIARRRDGVAFLTTAVVFTGVVLATAALLHPAFGAHKLFGVYEPGPGVAERHLAPLMNPNNLAGYLNVALCLAFAATLSPEPVIPRAIAGAMVLFLGATQLWVASRGGVVAMALGVLIVLSMARMARMQRGREVATLTLVAGFAAAVGATLIVLGGSEEASNELLQTDVSKLTIFVREMRMLPSVPLFGCGRGAFESSFPTFRVDVGHMTYAYPENVVAQWILEWGLPVGIAGLAIVAFALRPRAVFARSTTAAGAWAALVALAVQNFGDMGSEIPGLMLAGVVAAAIVVAGTPGQRPRWAVEGWGKQPRLVAAVAVAAAATGIALVARLRGGELHEDQISLRDAALNRLTSMTEMHELARAAMLRHPGEPYLPFVVALRASYSLDDGLVPWVGATLDRASVYGPAHLLLGRILARRSPSQARLEYRLAMQQAGDLEGIALRESAHLVGTYQDAMQLVPEGPDAAAVVEQIGLVIRDRLPATQVRLDDEVAARAPARPGPSRRATENAILDLEADTVPWCEGTARNMCVRDALHKATRSVELEPDSCDPHVLHARARICSGEREGGLRELEIAADTVKDRIHCLEELATLSRAMGSVARDDIALSKVIATGCSDDAECLGALIWVAQQEDSRGNGHKALLLYKRAFERAPDNDSLLVDIALHAEHAGLHAEAAEAYGKLAAKHPDDGRWKKSEEEQRDVAMKAATGL